MLLVSAGGFILLCIIYISGLWISGHLKAEPSIKDEPKSDRRLPDGELPRARIIAALKESGLAGHDAGEKIGIRIGGRKLNLDTTINPKLQNYINGLLARSKTHEAAVVVIRPEDGRILAMADYDEAGLGNGVYLQSRFPAASLFKIIAATAALESAGFTPEKKIAYAGRKHTLYKSQLKKSPGRYATTTSLRNAFASSINPVFGRLGTYYLGKDLMGDYAQRFFFNKTIDFELQIGVSTVSVPEDDFGLAEIASGFNKKTLISPVHAALLASAVANRGVMMRPWFIKDAREDSGNTLYRGSPKALGRVMKEKTAVQMRVLMNGTVIYGTCRKSLKRLLRKKMFRKVELGAKTGTINDMDDRYKYDWLSAYALPEKGKDGVCISVLVVHGKTLGVRANELGRAIINYHFAS